MKKKILLLGDPTIDIYHLYNKPPVESDGKIQSCSDWQRHKQWRSWKKEGGIYLIAEFMKQLKLDVKCITSDRNNTMPSAQLASLALLDYVKHTSLGYRKDADDAQKDLSNARVSRFEGYQELQWKAENNCKHCDGISQGYQLNMGELEKPDDQYSFGVIAISDAGSDLRHDFRAKDHPILRNKRIRDKPIVLKMHQDLGNGKIWKWYKELNNAKRFLIVSAQDLRATKIQINHCLSWDSVVEDVRKALQENDDFKDLIASSSHVIILFDVEGALILSKSDSYVIEMKLVVDPTRTEGSVDRHNHGDLVGKMSVFFSQFCASLDVSSEGNVIDAVKQAMISQCNFAESAMELSLVENPGTKSQLHELRYPSIQTEEQTSDSDSRFSVIALSTEAEGTSILSRTLQVRNGYGPIACSIVKKGFGELKKLPHGKFGNYITLDRDEIEGLRAIQQLLDEFMETTSVTKPISIAVFGPPGSGKSFMVKELIDTNINPFREFNLSQANEKDLPGFFHEIRDVVLEGRIPLCFFDEFDAHEGALIASFLAPMQDGKFRDGARTHPIGKAIFIFAGGVYENYSDFFNLKQSVEVDTSDRDVGIEDLRRRLKIPDFASRLSGHLNIKGISKVIPGTGSGDVEDQTYMLRRAVVLRAMLEKHMPAIFTLDTESKKNKASIENDLLNWFIKEADFIHGNRSMEQLIKMSSHTADRVHFSLSDLPLGNQLRMHARNKPT